jgi:hypothetical protein
MLLAREFPSSKAGWVNLASTEYPSQDIPPTNAPPEGGLSSWKDYMSYRDLSTSSIAPLLLTNVLTVYNMLRCCLDMTKPGQSLTAYLLGPELELNQIPLFGELAFLFPEIDLTLVWMSPAVKAICDLAKKTKSQGILGSAVDGVVLDVQAPINVGGGRVRIKLDGTKEYFDSASSSGGGVPDAIVALNAGLGAYPQWADVLRVAVKDGIPFACTDTTIVSQRYAQLYNFAPVFRPLAKIQLNPFHGVVARDVAAILVPNISNGYILSFDSALARKIMQS